MMLSPPRFRFVLFCVPIIVAFSATTKSQAQPTLNEVFPSGFQIGASTRVTLSGQSFDESLQVLLGDGSNLKCPVEIHSINDKQADVSITLDESLEEGLNAIRIVTRNGVSNPAWVCLDRATPVAWPRDANDTSAVDLPAAWNGRISGDQRLHLPFAAEKGDVVVVQAWAKRIGSNLRPVLRILDATNNQVAWQAPQPHLSQDALLAWEVPASGDYQLELHDVTYRAPGNSPFHVSLSTSPLRESVFPFSNQLDSTFQGSLQSFYTIQGELDEAPAQAIGEKVSLGLEASFPGWYRVPNNVGADVAIGAPRLWIDALPEYVESEHEAGGLQVIADKSAPLNIHGRLVDGERADEYRVAVRPLQRLRCEVWAERMGSPLDAVLEVRDAAGNELGRNDDRPGTTDPEVIVTVPGGSDHLTLHISDLTFASGDRFQYRIAVEDISAGEIQARLATDHLINSGANLNVVPILLDPKGYRGRVEFKPVNVPEGWSLVALPVSGSADQGLLQVQRISNDAHPGTFSLACLPANKPASATLVTFAVPEPAKKEAPWLARFVAVASAPAPKLQLKLAGSITDNTSIFAGGELRLPCTVDADEELPADAKWQFQLVTSQQPIKKTIKVDNKDQVVDDLDRMIHLVGETNFSRDDNVEVQIAIPADLPADSWQCALIMEATSADGKTILARTAATPFDLQVQRAFTIAMPNPDKPLEVTAGNTLTVTGSIEPLEGFANPIRVEASGLPEGWAAQPQTVDASSNTFELVIHVPEGQAAADVNSVMIQATATPTGDQDESVAIASAIPSTLKIKVKAATTENASDK